MIDHSENKIPNAHCHCMHCDMLRADGVKNFAELSPAEASKQINEIKNRLAARQMEKIGTIATCEGISLEALGKLRNAEGVDEKDKSAHQVRISEAELDARRKATGGSARDHYVREVLEASRVRRKEALAEAVSAAGILCSAASAVEDRAAQRDQPSGERSMGRAVAMYRALNDGIPTSRGALMSELDGWRFMVCLKLARSIGGGFNADDYIDMAGYAALAGECAAKAASHERHGDSLQV